MSDRMSAFVDHSKKVFFFVREMVVFAICNEHIFFRNTQSNMHLYMSVLDDGFLERRQLREAHGGKVLELIAAQPKSAA